SLRRVRRNVRDRLDLRLRRDERPWRRRSRALERRAPRRGLDPLRSRCASFELALFERAVLVEELGDHLTFGVPDAPAALAPALKVLALCAKLPVLVPGHPRTIFHPATASIPRFAPSLIAVRRIGAEEARALRASDRRSGPVRSQKHER